MRVLVLVVLLLLVGCKTPAISPEGHNCSEIQIDSIHIVGEHVCFAEECICSYEEDEWFVIVEQLVYDGNK